MKKILTLGVLAFLISACSTSAKNADEGDIFTELRKLNLVDEKSLTPGEKEEHDQHKAHLNDRLTDFLAQPENTTEFPSLEDKKNALRDDIISLNKQDESVLNPDELEDLRNQRTKDIDDLQALLEKAKLFQNLKNLNKVDESSLSPKESEGHQNYKKDLTTQLENLLAKEENKSSNPKVEERKKELLDELKDLNATKESTLEPQALEDLRKNRENDLQELLGLLDGSIVPEDGTEAVSPEQKEEVTTPPPAVEEPPATPEVKPAQEENQPEVEPQTEPEEAANTQEMAPENEESTPSAESEEVKKPRGPLFEELLKLNDVDENSLSDKDKQAHNALKQDLNRELEELLSKDENKLGNPSEEKEKNDLKDELISLNNKDESTMTPEELAALRDRRTQIVERLQDLLKNAKRTEPVELGIVSSKEEGVSVKQEDNGAVNITFNNLQFAFNKTDLRPGVRKVLDGIAKYLKRHAELRVRMGGHSDNIGPEWAKRKVANGRATNSRDYLVRAGVNRKRMTARGYSDRIPLARPFTSKNRRKNRRVEIHITNPKVRGGEKSLNPSIGNILASVS